MLLPVCRIPSDRSTHGYACLSITNPFWWRNPRVLGQGGRLNLEAPPRSPSITTLKKEHKHKGHQPTKSNPPDQDRQSGRRRRRALPGNSSFVSRRHQHPPPRISIHRHAFRPPPKPYRDHIQPYRRQIPLFPHTSRHLPAHVSPFCTPTRYSVIEVELVFLGLLATWPLDHPAHLPVSPFSQHLSQTHLLTGHNTCLFSHIATPILTTVARN